MLDPERIDVRGVRMIEPRGELGLAHEALEDHVVAAQPLVEDLDHGLAAQQGLLAAIDGAESAFVDALTKDELANHPSAEIFVVPHPVHTVSPIRALDHHGVSGRDSAPRRM
jgi:hypothetical protein